MMDAFELLAFNSSESLQGSTRTKVPIFIEDPGFSTTDGQSSKSPNDSSTAEDYEL